MSAQVLQQTTYTLTLSDQERDDLLALLRRAFAESRVEVHRTHTPDFRDLVVGQAAVLRGLVEKLERALPDQGRVSPATPVALAEEMPVIDDLFIDDQGRFQMAAADLEDFLPFLRDHEVRVETEPASAFQSGGVAYGYGRLVHPYDAESVSPLYRTWRLAQGS
jgi:hypothetical protein